MSILIHKLKKKIILDIVAIVNHERNFKPHILETRIRKVKLS